MVARWVALLMLLAHVAWGGMAMAGGAATSRVAKPVIEPARGGQCVEEPSVMRRNHMEYLKHQRDDTVHGGVRGAKYSLKTCIECHASQTTQSVAAKPTNFCVSCHAYAAVKIDCFECHSTQPKQGLSFHPLIPKPDDLASWQRSLQLRQVLAQTPFKP